MNFMIEDLLSIKHLRRMNVDVLHGKRFSGVSTDSRAIRRGDVFVALRGENFDGHEFIGEAFQRGAVCAVVEGGTKVAAFPGHPMLIVEDTTKTFGKLANVYRKKFDIPVIVVAGSNGKTTTKEMISAVLGTTYSVLSTEGNLNNHIGVPRTLFRLHERHEVAVIEAGTNHFGELAYLCRILEPTHGLITNIGREHLEFFGNLSGVARAEGEVFTALGRTGTGYVNVDDARIVAQAGKLRKKISYGFTKSNVSVAGTSLRRDRQGCFTFSVTPRKKKGFQVQLSVPGEHAMYNALAAAAVGISFDVQPKNIKHALKTFSSVGKRMEVKQAGGVTILNDTYNANPDSVLSALETLQGMNGKGKKIVILGDMLEMGDAADREHRTIGETIKNMGFEYILTFGAKAKNIYRSAKGKFNKHYMNKKSLSNAAFDLLSPSDIVLVKGSRGMKMEEVVNTLVERLEYKSA